MEEQIGSVSNMVMVERCLLTAVKMGTLQLMAVCIIIFFNWQYLKLGVLYYVILGILYIIS